MRRFRFIEGAFCESCYKWGYQEVRTPTMNICICSLPPHPDAKHVGKVYSFLDWTAGAAKELCCDGRHNSAVRLYIDEMAERNWRGCFT